MGLDHKSNGNAVFVHERLMESCEDDPGLAIEVLEDFQDTAPGRLSRIAAAAVASDPAIVRLEAHSLKGSSRTIGAEAMASVGERLELAGKSGELSSVSPLLGEAELHLQDLYRAITVYVASQQGSP